MKKLLIIMMMAVLLLSGCQKEEKVQTARIVTLAKDEIDAGLVLFLDEDCNIIEQKEIEYPYLLFYSDSAYYYSEDGINFKGLDYQSHQSVDDLENVQGSPLALDGGHYYTYITGGICMIDGQNQETCVSCYLNSSMLGEDYFYFIDQSNFFYSCSRSDFSLVNSQRLSDSEYLCLAKVDNEVYIASDAGFTAIEDGVPTTTYIYPNDFQEIYNIIGDKIIVKEDGEKMVYQVSFDKHKMILSPIYDESYYQSVDFEKEYEDYYADGYYVKDYYIIGE